MPKGAYLPRHGVPVLKMIAPARPRTLRTLDRRDTGVIYTLRVTIRRHAEDAYLRTIPKALDKYAETTEHADTNGCGDPARIRTSDS
jgi:hypothetical protein